VTFVAAAEAAGTALPSPASALPSSASALAHTAATRITVAIRPPIFDPHLSIPYYGKFCGQGQAMFAR
jgi:hypothetical protein